VLEAKARITLASVHAASGDYRIAVPMLRAHIERLRRCGGTAQLLADACAELDAYETLLGEPSPKA